MILCGFHGYKRCAVRKRKHRAFRSGQKFFDNDAFSGISENTVGHNATQGVLRFFRRFCNDCSFAERKPVCLYDDGIFILFLDV